MIIIYKQEQRSISPPLLHFIKHSVSYLCEKYNKVTNTFIDLKSWNDTFSSIFFNRRYLYFFLKGLTARRRF